MQFTYVKSFPDRTDADSRAQQIQIIAPPLMHGYAFFPVEPAILSAPNRILVGVSERSIASGLHFPLSFRRVDAVARRLWR